MLDFLNRLLWIVEVAVGLGILIFLHELGHFLMAKRHRVRVEIFSLGFGPVLWRRRRGETEYRISAVPLGGYVKMTGETYAEERKGEPWELTSKGAWPRFQIFVAGALMNLGIAFPIAVTTHLWGKYELSNVVGEPGVPETLAQAVALNGKPLQEPEASSHHGIRQGDRIVDVDGRPIDSLDKYRIEMVRRSVGTAVPVKVLRGSAEVTLHVVAQRSPYHATWPPSTFLRSKEHLRPDSLAWRAGLRPGDEVVEADGKRIYAGRELDEKLRKNPGIPVRLTVIRRNDAWDESPFELILTPPPREYYALPEEAHLMEAIVGAVSVGKPAYGKLEPEDRIVRIGGKEIRCWRDLQEIVESSPAKPLVFRVDRQGTPQEFRITPTVGETGRGFLGISIGNTKILARVPESSFYYEAGFRDGDELEGVVGGEQAPAGRVGETTVRDLFAVRGTSEVTVHLRRKGQPIQIAVTLPKRVEGDLEALGFITEGRGTLPLEHTRPFRRRGFTDAVRAGLWEPFDVGVMTFEVLRKLVSGQESAKGLAGPVGIAQVSYKMAEVSFGNFLWLLCLITVNLGVFNLLPIPILDGGHVVLLAIEKLRGRPPSERFVAGFQYAGLIFILALVVFVTYNDFSRMASGG